MKEQDMRAVEGMVRCGIDLEGLCSVFHSFPKAEVEEIYHACLLYTSDAADE